MTGIVSYLTRALSFCWNASTVNDKDELKLDPRDRPLTTMAGDAGFAPPRDEGAEDIPKDIPDKDRLTWLLVIHKTWHERGAGTLTLDLEAYKEGIRELDPVTRKHLRERVTELMDKVPELNTFKARKMFWTIKKIDDEIAAMEMEEKERAFYELERAHMPSCSGNRETGPNAVHTAAHESTPVTIRDRTACMSHPARPLPQPKGDEHSTKPAEFITQPAAEQSLQAQEVEEPDQVCDELMAQNLDWRINGSDGSRATAMQHFDAITRALAHGMVDTTSERRVALKTERMYQILSDAAKYYAGGSRNTNDAVLTKTWDLNMHLIGHLVEPVSRVEQYLAAVDDRMPIDIKQYLINPEREVEQDEIRGSAEYWNKNLRLLPAFERVLPMHCDMANPKSLADAQSLFREFLAMAASEDRPVLAILNLPNHWIGLVATIVDGKPASYICDTNGSRDSALNKATATRYIAKLAYFSNGCINATNTTYCGYPMQENTPNACGPLACWMLEELMWKNKADPESPIDARFELCYKTWLYDIAGREWQEEFVRLLRARMLARMGA